MSIHQAPQTPCKLALEPPLAIDGIAENKMQADARLTEAFMKVQPQLPALLCKNQPTCAIAEYASAISWQECIPRCCHAPMQRPAPTGTRTSVDKPVAALRRSRSSVPAAAECSAGLLKRMQEWAAGKANCLIRGYPLWCMCAADLAMLGQTDASDTLL